MQKRKDVLTTGQVAEICHVAPRTVTKWFDSGQLKGYRIPGSRDRRIPAGELIRFMKAHDIPTDELEEGQMRILIIDGDWEFSKTLAESLSKRPNFLAHIATNSFDAGILAQKMFPHVILINLLSKELDTTQVCRQVQSNPELAGTKVIAVAENLGEKEIAALIQKGFDGVIVYPADIEHVVSIIKEVTAIVY